MKVEATRSTALVAGAGSRLALTMLDTWERSHPLRLPIDEQSIGLFGIVVLFAIWGLPLVFFVAGFDSARLGGNRDYPQRTPAEIREIWIRSAFWFAGAAVAGISTSLVR